ncbi:MAG: hypothetical protein M1826_007429 [Phylliscum demangeonii]|nr:MAG: hypothetical protein M1826_007429 [Phylliscum demangeonii]
MKRIQRDLKLSELPRPCDYFHLIGGTSTGGLIALMLGRLRMNTTQALQAYNTISGSVFSKKNKKRRTQDGLFKATTLKSQIEELVADQERGDEMLDETENREMGKAFVAAMPAHDMAYPRLFRTYGVRENASANCKIWEAARATTAAVTFFKRIAIGQEGSVMEEFIDAGIKCNNPAIRLLSEAQAVFGDDRALNCLVSIGTGHPGVIDLSKPDTFQKIIPTGVVDVLRKIATDCEGTAHELRLRFKKVPDSYFRFNVTRGAGSISLQEWERMGEVKTHTKAYLEETAVSDSINAVPCYFGRCLPRSSPHFTGRRSVLDKLVKYFGNHQVDPLRKRQFLLHGMGGAGKSQLAMRFAEEAEDRFDHIIWIDASSQTTIEQDFKDIAQRNSAISGETGSALIKATLRWLENMACEWLVIYDNADDPDIIHWLLQEETEGNVLYTSKNPHMGFSLPREARFAVEEMNQQEAIELLLRFADSDEPSEDIQRLAAEIVEELGHLPLAIVQAGAYIFKGTYRFDDFLRQFRKHRARLMKNPAFLEARESARAVYTTWDLSCNAILNLASEKARKSQEREFADSAIQILNLFAFLHNENIMEAIFERAAKNSEELCYSKEEDPNGELKKHIDLPRQLLPLDEDGDWDSFLFRGGINLLVSFSLIKQDESGKSYSMHRLVHSWAEDRIAKLDQQRHLRAVHALLSASLTRRDIWKYDVFRRKLLPHIKRCDEQYMKIGISALERVEESIEFGRVFSENAEREKAEEIEKQVLETHERVLGPEHPETLRSMSILALTYAEQGRWDDAKKLQVQNLEIHKRVLGPEHPDTLASMHNLAWGYCKQGRWDEAAKLQVQNLEMRMTVLGPEHPDTLSGMGNLAFTYGKQGRWDEAEKLQVQDLEIRKRVLGPEHPDTLTGMSNLASTYEDQGRWDEAEKLRIQNLEISKRVLGPEHPDTLIRMSILAWSYRPQGRWDEAENLQVQNLEIGKRVLGPEHPDTLTSMGSLAFTYWKQGRWDEAEKLEVQNLEIRMKMLGPEHPDTLTSMEKLALTYRARGRWEEAEKIQIQNLEIRMKVLGPEHPDTLISVGRLALIYEHQERWDEAEKLYIQKLEMGKRVLGPEHPDTLTSMGHLAMTYWHQGRWDETEKLEVQNLEISMKVLGPEHPDTLTSMDKLALTYRARRRWDEAEKLQIQNLEIRMKVLGQEHPDTLSSMDNLALTYWHQGRWDETEKIQAQNLEIRKRVLGPGHPDTLRSNEQPSLDLPVSRTVG